jgi:hypothetical protein
MDFTKVKLSLTTDRDLPSQFTNALTGRRIDLPLTEPDDVHPYTALAVRWRDVSQSATALLKEFRLLQAAALAGDSFAPKPASTALKTLIYNATETIDLYDKYIPKLLKHGRIKPEEKAIKVYKDGVDRLRTPIATICNRMKHNGRDIVMCQIRSEATQQTTFVYRVNAAYGDVQRADEVVHLDGEHVSIERTLHEVVHSLLRADYEASKLVLQLAENCDQPIELKGLSKLGLAGFLDELGRYIPFVASSEPNRFDGITVKGNELFLTRRKAARVPEPTSRQMYAIVDEVARSIKLI